MNAKKVILILALIVLIILFFLVGLPSKIINSLTGTDTRQAQTAKSKPVVVTKKIPPSPAAPSPGAKADQSKIVTKKIPSQPSTGTSGDAGKKKPEPAGKVTQAPQKTPSAKSQTAKAKAQQAPASKKPVAAKADITPSKPEKVVAAKAETSKPDPAPVPQKATASSPKPEPAAPEKTAVTKTEPPKSKQVPAAKKPVKAPQTAAPTARQQAAATKSIAPSSAVTNYPYSIMLASCRLKKSAREVVARNRKKGLTPHIVKVDLGPKGVWWRVFTGQYQNRDEARRVKQEHNLKDSLIKKTPYVNQIGIFDSDKKAAAMASRLEKLGYSPYVIKTKDNTLRLVTGVFITREGAKPQKSELAAKGIQSRIVKR